MKLGRNDPCPCGSGKKFKKCCQDQAVVSAAVQRFQENYATRLTAHQEQTHQQMIEAMKANGMDPAYIYAAEKSGVIVFQETMHLLSPEELERFQSAYEEFERLK